MTVLDRLQAIFTIAGYECQREAVQLAYSAVFRSVMCLAVAEFCNAANYVTVVKAAVDTLNPERKNA